MPGWLRWLLLAGLMSVGWLCYRPGLGGGFLFDDFVNLNALGGTGPVDDWPTFWRYVTSGSADPTGRPLSMLSFLLDARDWPADAGPFLRTNVLLHLFNGALLFQLLRQLGRCLDGEGRGNDLAALLGAALWLLHPLLVSTTLYVVQREAILPATFVLLGLIAYAHGRARFSASAGQQGVASMAAGIVAGTALALACKGNGVLLPLLALVLEATVFARLPAATGTAARRLSRLRTGLLVVPSVAVLAYLASHLPTLFDVSAARGFSAFQRLLTQPRVLLDYLQLLAVPRSVSSGLYNDDYVVSTSLWHPWQTLPSLLLVAALCWFAYRIRMRAPALSAALLFFFAGHLLESSLILLELYFEHRNYLPALLLGWPVARAVVGWRRPAGWRMVLATLLLGLLAITTWQRANLWGQPHKLAELWALQGQSSSRAQATAAIADLEAGRSAQAQARLAPLWRARPYDLQIAFNYMSARCASDGPDAADKAALADALRHTPTTVLLTHEWLATAIETASAGECPGLRLDDVATWIGALAANPVYRDGGVRNQDLEPLQGMLEAARGQPAQALLHFDRALRARPSPDTAARQAVMLASAGYYAQALAHLDTYEQVKSRVPPPGPGMAWVHHRVLERQGYWPHEMAVLRGKLRAELHEGPK